eukprot:CAMPEP_0117677230 /NCGR_PEP_ID=MMETSP0804-20121206/16634_1 /TAXON_ID=1074897 /ORGANISM="Tetraselmis astigmatica, Strain CCMP880" /LENGTH=71 /DNA_ID=CAMNT_0005486499 /DNA_START=276 /DNA_END=491 /DNA_ORIENTATION=+
MLLVFRLAESLCHTAASSSSSVKGWMEGFRLSSRPLAVAVAAPSAALPEGDCLAGAGVWATGPGMAERSAD